MSNPFDNVPSSADVPEAVDKKMVSKLENLFDRDEQLTARKEAIVKNEEELAGVLFEMMFDDDGSLKDFAHIAEFRELNDGIRKNQDRSNAFLAEILRSIPRSIQAQLNDEDREKLDSNFKSWRDVFKLYLPALGIVGMTVGIILTGCFLLSNKSSGTKHEYEQRISQLETWYEDNADAIAFGQFYRENFPKQYRQWHTGQWQQDIAYRDSLRRAHSLDRLKRIYEDRE